MIGKSHFRVVAAALVLAAAMGVPASARETKPTTDDLIKRWADGPVRYLMTYKEDEAVHELKTVPELARFISDFWARRDPTRGTFENQFRRTYWGRVLEADHRFRDSTTPGWKTDRGKIYILLGKPDEVQTDERPSISAGIGPQSETADTGGAQRGIERWTYRRHNSRATDTEFIVAFVRDASLDWKLSTDPTLIQPNFPGSVTSDGTDVRFGGLEGAGAQERVAATRGQGAGGSPAMQTPQAAIRRALPSLDTSLFANYDLGLETSVPSTTEEVIATVTAREFLSAFPATARFEFFRAADGGTFVDLGAIVKAEDLYPAGTTGRSTLRLYASVTPEGEGGPSRFAANDAQPVIVEPANGPAPGGVYDVWTGLVLKSGRYRVMFAIEDSLTGRIGRTAAQVDVPDFSGPGLHLSTLVLASDLSDAKGRLGATARASGTYRKAENLGIYYEVYGLAGGDSARFTTSYRFFREIPDGAPPAPIGKPIVFADRAGEVQGWSFPLAKWPPGRYRMEVTVTGADNLGVSDQVLFEVVE